MYRALREPQVAHWAEKEGDCNQGRPYAIVSRDDFVSDDSDEEEEAAVVALLLLLLEKEDDEVVNDFNDVLL